jgi:hypothetical protein
MGAELLMLMPGLGYETVKNFYWEELVFWHKEAVKVYKRMHGSG